MKTKHLLFSLGTIVFALQAEAQSFKYPLLEHFTQASCPPCAAQNPAFQANIVTANANSVHHLAYHTSWPGVDPMNAYNPTHVATRVTYYGITGVPSVILMGNVKESSPAGYTQSDIDAVIEETSPIKLAVTKTKNGSTINSTVNIRTIGTIPSGSYSIYVALYEKEKLYATPPGNNGELDFPNLFRKFITSENGDAIILPSLGLDSTYSFSIPYESVWDSTQVTIMAWIQNTTTKHILNSGNDFDIPLNTLVYVPNIKSIVGTTNNISTFNLGLGNSGAAAEDFLVEITSDAPNGWLYNFNLNGTTYSNSATISLGSNSNLATQINVTPNTISGIGKYTLSIKPTTNPNSPAIKITVFVTNNVTDLLLNSASGSSDPVYTNGAASWQNVYTKALVKSGTTSFGVVNTKDFKKIMEDNAFANVERIYFNVGWTFPSFDDNLIAELSDFLDNGKSLFIAGQDISWEAFAGITGPNQTFSDFINQYLKAGYIADGSTASNNVKGNPTDFVGSNIVSAAFNKTFYTASANFFPDELSVVTNGVKTFTYNNTTATAKVGGVRSNATQPYKTMYLGFGLEQLADSNMSNAIIDYTTQWFKGLINGAELDKKLAELNSQIYPNPANGNVTIKLPENSLNTIITLYDVTGRLVLTQTVLTNSLYQEINVSELENGKYILNLSGDNINSTNKSLIVQH